jgi:tungstate transport system ATP-binding protein
MDNDVRVPPVFQVEGVRKFYGDRCVVQIDDLSIYPGEITALVGPSGSGKSTLLRMLNFIEYPSQGTIIFNEERFHSERAIPLQLRRRISTVFQRPILLNRTVRDNAAFGLQIQNKKTLQKNIDTVLEELGLEKLAGNNARLLSGGEAQRVALARSILIQPEVLLLDEPTANLDPYNITIIEKIIQKLRLENRTTIVMVTHNVFQARRLADRVIFMLDGLIIEVSQTERFFQAPNDPRTRAFIRGEMVY